MEYGNKHPTAGLWKCLFECFLVLAEVISLLVFGLQVCIRCKDKCPSVIQCPLQANDKAFWDGVAWVGAATTSKLWSLPHSHIIEIQQ